MTPVSADEARRRFAGFPALPAEEIALGRAAGRVLAAPFVAPGPLPPWRRSAMDGVAVRAAETAAAPVVLSSAAAPAIATGGLVPDGFDAVVMVEHTEPAGPGASAVRVLRAASPGQHVIAVGEDIADGAELLPAGRRLGPADLAALAAFGAAHVPVVRRPRVAIVSTGSEVVPVSAIPAPGQVRDMNQVALAAAVAALGGEPLARGVVPDEPRALAAALAAAAGLADAVLVAGGSSVGPRDHTAPVLASLGAELLLHGIAVRPGRPTLLARLGGVPVVGLPGVPASALVITTAFVAPLVAALGGFPLPPPRRARLAVACTSAAGREDWLRVRLAGELATPLPGGAMSVGPLVAADALARVPAEVTALAAGDSLEVY